jgi:hypothetical protein
MRSGGMVADEREHYSRPPGTYLKPPVSFAETVASLTDFEAWRASARARLFS